MYKKIIPNLSSSEARKEFTNNIEAWRNFAQRITKNPFVKSFLLDRDGNKCSWCDCRFIKSPTIHHISYDHYCSFNKVITVVAPTLTHPYKKRIVPDCEKCKEGNCDRFLNCMDKLVLVHNFCNKKISEKEKKII